MSSVKAGVAASVSVKREAGAGVKRQCQAFVSLMSSVKQALAACVSVKREACAGVKSSCQVFVSSMKQALEASAGVWAAVCLTCVSWRK